MKMAHCHDRSVSERHRLYLMRRAAQAVEQKAADVLAMVGMNEAQRIQGPAL